MVCLWTEVRYRRYLADSRDVTRLSVDETNRLCVTGEKLWTGKLKSLNSVCWHSDQDLGALLHLLHHALVSGPPPVWHVLQGERFDHWWKWGLTKPVCVVWRPHHQMLLSWDVWVSRLALLKFYDMFKSSPSHCEHFNHTPSRQGGVSVVSALGARATWGAWDHKVDVPAVDVFTCMGHLVGIRLGWVSGTSGTGWTARRSAEE